MGNHPTALTLREKCPYSRILWSVFSHFRTGTVQIRENTDQKNSEYEHFSRRTLRLVFSFYTA